MSLNHKHTNRLIHATSPYLLQHAHNPVDWYEWGEEALTRAQIENKPILVSIGYSSCHWCHVMERESFEIERVADIMNASYVCIKVDREERPDIDQIYMEAVQALGVNGGWPLNVFLTPEQKPFFGGTYFSPQAWTQVLTNIHQAYRGNIDQVEGTAEELRLHLLNSDVRRFVQPPADSKLADDMASIYKSLSRSFDKQWGGMERAPKFVMPSVWRFLLRYYHLTNDNEALDHIKLTLDKISQGGIYDQVRGGFARYSVDGEWFAPHFEKMLYDNAQLISLYAEAYAITKDPGYKEVVYETVAWLNAEMTHQDGGFYSALDADSEGVEGKFYVWSLDEVKKVVGKAGPLIASYFQVAAAGNWEDGHNILFRAQSDDGFLSANNLSKKEWHSILQQSKTKLLQHRATRVRPGLDDKILTAWNAMTVCGLMDAYQYLNDKIFLDAAIRNMNFTLDHLTVNGILGRSFKNRRSSVMGFLDDYAFTIQALLKLYTGTFDELWIKRATAFTDYSIEHFYDPEEKFFYYTSNAAEKLITRKKEIFDNVIPSSNAVMAQNLFMLGTILDRDDWKGMATAMVDSLSQLIKGEPNYMTQWAIAMTEIKKGFKEVLIVGDGHDSLRVELQQHFRPFVIWMGSKSESELPLFEGKASIGGLDTIYVCEQKTCKLPVHSVNEAIAQLQ